MQFRGRYYFLSNFYPCTIVIDGFEYQSAEAAFQGQKSVQPAHLFTGGITPIEAKRLGKRVPIDVREWNARRLEVMKRVVWAKFAQNPKLRKLLIAVTEPMTVSQPIHVASPVYICVYPLYITDVPGEVMYTGTN